MHSKGQDKRCVVAIFAHPDDEAFGPAGTLAKFAKDHSVYILCATKGEAGGNLRHLGRVRAAELRKSAKILGIKKVYFLGFKDGRLSNLQYHALAAKIEDKLKILRPKTVITFEPLGISGHIDHIVVSLVTTYVFEKLPFVKNLLYHCITKEDRKPIKDYFIYFPPGYKKDEIGKIVGIGDVWEKKVASMMVHESQIKDAKRILKMRKNLPKEEYFLVRTKD